MNIFDRAVASVAPGRALQRARARKALEVLAHYDAATTGRRSKSWQPSATDADAAAARRQRLAFVSRDMIRNTPFAARAQSVIANNVVGDGIIPKIVGPTRGLQRRALELVEAHLDTTAIDADGRQNLYGLQRLAMNAIVDSGEVLIRRRRRRPEDGLPLPLQIQVLEADYLDAGRAGTSAEGDEIRDGIEYDRVGRRLAYYLFDEHPGGASHRPFASRFQSHRVPASEVLHVYRQDRPGQRRGVSWFAPVALTLQDMADHQDAQLMRTKIAACFAAFRVSPDGTAELDASVGGTLKPGAIMTLGPGEDIRLADPPKVDGFDEFTRVVLRSVAAAMGITYEALVGDLSNVNFSSARMGRMEMDRNVSSWQWLMMVPQFLAPFGQWFLEAWSQVRPADPRALDARIEWVPPHRILVDPTKEIPALTKSVRAGFTSRQAVIRQLGYDPERLVEEQVEDNRTSDASGLVFDSDPRQVSNAGLTQARPPGSILPGLDDGDDNASE